jgi:hypothetical protein
VPDITDDIDASGEAVRMWLDANVPAIDGLVPFTQSSQKGIETVRFELPPGQEHEVARYTAIGIIARRLDQRPAAFMAWHGHLTTGSDLGDHESLIDDHIEALVGTPHEPRPKVAVYGMVAEHLLWRVLLAVDRGLGLPLRIEGHDWDVTDHGGDSVAVYSTADGYAFRLWESKAVTGGSATPKKAVKTATGQLTRKGWEYLSRWATVARRLPDDELANFFVEMPDLWKLGDTRAGAGIAISTHAHKPTDTCFEGLVGKFSLPDENKLGNIVASESFSAFSKLVRRDIWKGAGWNVP